MNEADRPDWLNKHLAALPREIAPGRDLWPDIARRIAVPGRSRWPAAALAASVMLGIAAGWLGWRLQAPVPAPAVAVEQESVPEMMAASFGPARARYSRDWPRIREQIGPETAAVIERNLEIIRRANADLVTALEQQPDNPALRRLLRQTLAQEINVYQRAWDASRLVATTGEPGGPATLRGTQL